MGLFDALDHACARLAAAISVWGASTAPLFQQAVHRNCEDEARVDDLRLQFQQELDAEIGAADLESFDQEQFVQLWEKLRNGSSAFRFPREFNSDAAPDFGTIATTYARETTLLNLGYVPPRYRAILERRPESLPFIPLNRQYGSAGRRHPAKPVLWLTSNRDSFPLEADPDRLLDSLGLHRPAGIRLRAIRVPVAQCKGLAVPTAVEALPPFAPAAPGAPTGRTVAVNGAASLPEIIGSPLGLPDGQQAELVGLSKTGRAIDDFLRERLGIHA